MEQDSELQFLSSVHQALSVNSSANQRELAKYTNLSLGMTNALLRRFADKGWLYMKKISKRNIQYVLTPQGMKELAVRSKRYFKNTARLMNEYQGCIRQFTQEAVCAGCKKVILVDNSDLEFLFDYACHSCKISLLKIDSDIFFSEGFFVTDDALIVFSDEGRYEAFVKTAASEKLAKQCTTVLDILRSAEPLRV